MSDTDLPFNTNVLVTVNTVENADLYILEGVSFEKLTSQTRLSAGSTYTFSSKQVAVIIVKSIYDTPFVSFKYQNVQIIDNAGFIGMIIGASVGYFIILFVVVVWLSKVMTRNRLREM